MYNLSSECIVEPMAVPPVLFTVHLFTVHLPALLPKEAKASGPENGHTAVLPRQREERAPSETTHLQLKKCIYYLFERRSS